MRMMSKWPTIRCISAAHYQRSASPRSPNYKVPRPGPSLIARPNPDLHLHSILNRNRLDIVAEGPRLRSLRILRNEHNLPQFRTGQQLPHETTGMMIFALDRHWMKVDAQFISVPDSDLAHVLAALKAIQRPCTPQIRKARALDLDLADAREATVRLAE